MRIKLEFGTVGFLRSVADLEGGGGDAAIGQDCTLTSVAMAQPPVSEIPGSCP